jgi:HAD superfamily hydrolase (TIGR01457 family)
MQAFLIDMDGVLYRGNRPIPAALRFIDNLQSREIPFLLLTNHSCLTPDGFSLRLKTMYITVPAQRIYTSALATAEWLASQRAARVFVIGEHGLRSALRDRGIEIVEKDASHVVAGLDRMLSYSALTKAARLIKEGAVFVGTNPDPTYPVEDGDAPECGTILAALECASGATPIIIGKPSQVIYNFAARRLGLPIDKITMIGDRLDTDIAGARSAGAQSILTLTGHTTRDMLQSAKIQPDRVVECLSEVVLNGAS